MYEIHLYCSTNSWERSLSNYFYICFYEGRYFLFNSVILLLNLFGSIIHSKVAPYFACSLSGTLVRFRRRDIVFKWLPIPHSSHCFFLVLVVINAAGIIKMSFLLMLLYSVSLSQQLSSNSHGKCEFIVIIIKLVNINILVVELNKLFFVTEQTVSLRNWNKSKPKSWLS